jgi:hypothetical protein
MRGYGWARRLAAVLVAAAGLAGSPAQAGWPNTTSAQPMVQAPRICAAGVVPIDRRCHVVEFGKLGAFDKRQWFYAFYATHWADRHGRHDRGFPVIFYRQGPATLRLSLWVDDAPGLAGRWAMTAPPPPVLVQRGDDYYLGFSLKAEKGPDDQRLFRLGGVRWKQLNVLNRSDADQAVIDAAMPAGCSVMDDGLYDWTAFQLRIALHTDKGAPCGVMVVDLAPKNLDLTLTKAVVLRPTA